MLLRYARNQKLKLEGWENVIKTCFGSYRLTAGLRQETEKGKSLGLLERQASLKEALHSLENGKIQRDSTTFARLLKECGKLKARVEGKQIHLHMKTVVGLEGNLYLGNLLITMYAKCGCLEDAQTTFENMAERDVVSWTALISAYAQKGCGQVSLKLYHQMLQEGLEPNKITYVSVLNACCDSAVLSEGQNIHASIVDCGLQSDVIVGTALVNMYAKCGTLKQARDFFSRMPLRDVIAWNAMINATVRHEKWRDAFKLFRDMQKTGMKPNKVTFVSMLEACAGLEDISEGKLLHLRIVDSGLERVVALGNSLINMYAKCGSFNETREVFEKMTERDIISWNAMILACVKHGKDKLALDYFAQMERESLLPDEITFLTALDACANIGLLHAGKQYHNQIVERGFETNVSVGNALVNMYGKCGSPETARRMFDKMPERDVISWTTLITASAQHGCGESTLALFGHMQWEATYPNNVTFICVFAACSHAGLVEEGQHYFASIAVGSIIQLNMEHYATVIDLLGRAGYLREAEDVIATMPFTTDQVIWMTLLGSCKLHRDIDRGRRAAERLLELDPHNATPFVMLSNIYAAAGRWEDAMVLRRAMVRNNATKEPGYSLLQTES